MAINQYREGMKKKLETILVDDEGVSLRSLRYELEKYCPNVEIVDELTDPVMAIESIKEHDPDLVFLDIEMPRINGFDLLQSFSSINFDVIFVTAYDEFAVRAFEFNAIDYLLKPVLKSKLIQSVNKVAVKQRHQFAQEDLHALMQNIQRNVPDPRIPTLAIPTQEGFEIIHISEITHLQAESNYTWVFLAKDEKYLVSRTMKEVAEMINSSQFLRVHKSYFVNLNHIRKYVRGRGGYLILRNGLDIPVSRNQRSDLLEALNL